MAASDKDKWISAANKEWVEDTEQLVDNFLKSLKENAKFNLGDYLIGFQSSWGKEKELMINSYGAIRKFQVVYIDKHGHGYIKELNRNGRPSGTLQRATELLWDDGYDTPDITYELDPHYTDAVIMADSENYDAGLAIKEKAKQHKEITEHNKKHKVKTHSNKDFVDFVKSLKVGDVLHKSIKTHFTILSLNSIPLRNRRYGKGKVEEYLDYSVDFGTAQDSKGKFFKINGHTFDGTIYTQQPRSFKELKDPK